MFSAPLAASTQTTFRSGRGRQITTPSRSGMRGVIGTCSCDSRAAPDVVGDASQTLRNFSEWRSELVGFPVALVGQDGLETPPWDEFDALFIGGTTEWKMGAQAARLVREGKERGKWVHMGRVNSYERGRYARWLGCDSIDGTQFSWFRDTKLPAYLNSLKQEMFA